MRCHFLVVLLNRAERFTSERSEVNAFSPGTCRLKYPICVPESERLQLHSIRISKRLNNHLIPAGAFITKREPDPVEWITTSSALFGACKSESLREDLAVTFLIDLQGRKLVRHSCYSRNSVPQTHKLPTFLFNYVDEETELAEMFVLYDLLADGVNECPSGPTATRPTWRHPLAEKVKSTRKEAVPKARSTNFHVEHPFFFSRTIDL